MNKKIIIGIVIFFVIIVSIILVINKHSRVVDDISEIDFLPKCGDGVCEETESEIYCCQDCGCSSENTYCDLEQQFCLLKDLNLSWDFMEQTYKDYYNVTKEIADEDMLSYASEVNNTLTQDFCVAYLRKANIIAYDCISIDKDGNVLKEYITNR